MSQMTAENRVGASRSLGICVDIIYYCVCCTCVRKKEKIIGSARTRKRLVLLFFIFYNIETS